MLKFGAAFSRTRKTVPMLVSALALASLIILPAEGRHWRHHRHGWPQAHLARSHHHRDSIRYGHAIPGTSETNIAAIVVDGNSGRTLYARNENELWHPASITKVMTLYLLFEQLEQGHLRLDSEIRISAHAAAQKPTKLGLHPGQTIRVEDAIEAAVTRSANDIAVAIAETISGNEESFARLMTVKAHALGMSSTHFANASGLPDPDQVTTARDLAILGRAIQERFPRYYRYFATRIFHYRGASIANHNHLMDRVEGMDGIKTGYTNASGFNLLTSVKRDGHYIVAVVLGGSTARARDNIMAKLIEDQIDNGATVRTASLIAEPAVRTAAAEAPQRHEMSPHGEQQTKITLRVPIAPPAQRPGAAANPIQVALLNADMPPQKPRPAFVSGAPKPEPALPDAARDSNHWDQASLDGSTAHAVPQQAGELATATPATTRASARLPAQGKIAATTDEAPQEDIATSANGRRPAMARGGWMIQIGATGTMDKAAELLTRAKSADPKALTGAQAFTEKVQKGPETFYRARFAGLEEESAELACKTLKRSGFSCFATRN
jgi:D-alanyl-D-alanine carboxypeptidase